MEAINNITRFLRNVMDENVIEIDAHGVSVSLSKVDISRVDEQVFRAKSSEVDLPGDLFTKSLKEALQGGIVQVGTSWQRSGRVKAETIKDGDATFM